MESRLVALFKLPYSLYSQETAGLRVHARVHVIRVAVQNRRTSEHDKLDGTTHTDAYKTTQKQIHKLRGLIQTYKQNRKVHFKMGMQRLPYRLKCVHSN
jgi:hypothetical protein